MPAGTLYVVATPIGNLEDITLRALRILREVDLIAAEDTRRTAKLLAHYEIRKPLVSLHEHNEWKVADRLVEQLRAGRQVALVSDAGTPGIADPGMVLVNRCREAGLPVSPIPGPSAITAALSISGQPAGAFVFAGFPPRSGRDREAWFEAVSQESRTVVFYETPHRIDRTLSDGRRYWLDRTIICNRELTKIHEQSIIWPISVSDWGGLPSVGEFVVLLGPRTSQAVQAGEGDGINAACSLFDCMTINCGFTDEFAIELAARAFGISKPSLSKALKKRRIAEKQKQDRRS